MSPRAAAVPRDLAADALQRSTGALSTTAMARMETDMPWFRELSAEDRSWVGLIVQAGIRGFVDWYRDVGNDTDDALGGSELAAAVFGAAPRALAGVINLQQTVDLVRLSIEVVESNIDEILDPELAPAVHAAVLRYAREVAFATAEVYARAAELRGAWDARLEALVVDAVLRSETDEAVLSRASALGLVGRRRCGGGAGRSARPADRDRRLRRGTPRGPRRGHGRAVCHAGRAPGRRPGRRRREPQGGRGRGRTCSGTVRSSSDRSPRD